MAKATEDIAARSGNKYYGAKGFGAIGAFFGNYVNFTGRSTRREFWWWSLWYALISLIMMIGFLVIAIGNLANWTKLDELKDLSSSSVIPLLALMLVYLVVMLAMALPGLSLTIRRFRDAGVPWWVYVILMAINFFASIVWGADSNTTVIIAAFVALAMFVIEVLPSKPLPE